MAYDNTKSHKETGFQSQSLSLFLSLSLSLFIEHPFLEKPQEGGQISPTQLS